MMRFIRMALLVALTLPLAVRGPAGRADHAQLQGRRPRAGHRGRQPGDRQEFHRGPARAGPGDDAVDLADECRRLLRGFPRDPAGARFRRGAVRFGDQDPAGRDLAPDAGERPAGPRQFDLGRDRHAGGAGPERQRRPAGADPAADDAAVRAPGRLSERQHADHLGPRLEREPHDAHRRPHRPHRRRRFRDDPPRARLGQRDRARDQCAERRPGRRCRGRRARRRRRAHQQRADLRRDLAAAAFPHPDHAPRHAARGRRRHAGAVPALRGCREARDQAEGAVGGGRGGAARRRRLPPAASTSR